MAILVFKDFSKAFEWSLSAIATNQIGTLKIGRRGHGTLVYSFCNFLWMYLYFKVKMFWWIQWNSPQFITSFWICLNFAIILEERLSIELISKTKATQWILSFSDGEVMKAGCLGVIGLWGLNCYRNIR